MCKEINACETDNGGCADSALCTKTGPGRKSCACNYGYEGDGQSCTARNMCGFKHGNCSTHASCKSGPSVQKAANVSSGVGEIIPAGEVRCSCNMGYEGDGVTCQMIDLCKVENPCAENSVCTMLY